MQRSKFWVRSPVGGLRPWRTFCLFVWAGLEVLWQPRGANAERFYVAPSGNDSAAGDAAAPWQTLQHAANQVGPGDMVVVRPGEYTGFDLQQSGTAAAPINFLGLPGAVVTAPNARTPDGINLELASHVIVDGFEVTGAGRAGIRAVGLPEAPASHVTLRNNRAHDNGRWGIFTGFVDDLLIEQNETSGSADEHGIYVSNSGDRPIVRRNVVWGNHASGIQLNADASVGGDGIISDAKVQANVIFDNGDGGGSGINLDGVQDSVIANNLLYDNRASGISLFRIDGAEGASGNLVAHNTIVQPSDGRWALNIQNGSTDNTVRNNVLLTAHSFRGSLDVSTNSLSGLSSDYNGVMDRFTLSGGNSVLRLSEWQSETGQDEHSRNIDASVFRDAASGNYRLAEDADAVDAGVAVAPIEDDLAGRGRAFGEAADLGAYEWRPDEFHAADFNADGDVDGDDLLDLLLNHGIRYGGSVGQGDANGDGAIDRADFSIWRQGFSGQGVQGAATLGVAVPEPDAIVLLVAISLFVVGRRLRRRE